MTSAHRRAPCDEVRALRATGQQPYLTKSRWLLLKRPKNLRRGERTRVRDLRWTSGEIE